VRVVDRWKSMLLAFIALTAALNLLLRLRP
jgi:hypothetical protein